MHSGVTLHRHSSGRRNGRPWKAECTEKTLMSTRVLLRWRCVSKFLIDQESFDKSMRVLYTLSAVMFLRQTFTFSLSGLFDYQWFKGGETNICYNAVDRHVEAGRGNDIAIIWEGNDRGVDRKLTYKQLLDEICQVLWKPVPFAVSFTSTPRRCSHVEATRFMRWLCSERCSRLIR